MSVHGKIVSQGSIVENDKCGLENTFENQPLNGSFNQDLLIENQINAPQQSPSLDAEGIGALIPGSSQKIEQDRLVNQVHGRFQAEFSASPRLFPSDFRGFGLQRSPIQTLANSQDLNGRLLSGLYDQNFSVGVLEVISHLKKASDLIQEDQEEDKSAFTEMVRRIDYASGILKGYGLNIEPNFRAFSCKPGDLKNIDKCTKKALVILGQFIELGNSLEEKNKFVFEIQYSMSNLISLL